MEATGKYEFTASAATELSFRKGDALKILSSEGAWYMAEMNGQEGYVPQSYLDVQMPRWFQENASRSIAEEDLMDRAVGHFLIRGCQSSIGDFSISVRHEYDVQHFKVIKDNMGHYFVWDVKFTSFNKMVDYYKTTSISKQRTILLKDGTEDNRTPPASLTRAGVVVPETPGQLEVAAGRRSPLPAPAGPAGLALRVAPVQVKAAPVQVRVAPVQARAPPTQGRAGPVQGRAGPGPVQGRAGPGPVQVRALYNFKVEEHDELGFGVGDIIEVLDCTDPSWWRGRLRGRSGLFPANYTTPL